MKPITETQFVALSNTPVVTERTQMLTHKHLTELYKGKEIVAVRTIRASGTSYKGVNV